MQSIQSLLAWRRAGAWLVAGAAALAAPAAMAVTLRVASQGDALSMDPHSLAEAVQFSVTGNVYEPLVERDRNFQLAPALATRWTQTGPTTWRFVLRHGVLFHDRSPFTADDVIFSWQRARGEGSDVKAYVAPIRDIVKVDAHTVDIETDGPYPMLPELITVWNIMSRSWCLAHDAARSVDRRKGVENAASFQANGTGPFQLRERVPGVRTVFRRNPVYWRAPQGNVDDVVFSVIGNDGTRLAALLSNEADVIDPLPVQDAARVAGDPALQVVSGPENRVLFLGMDQKRDALLHADAKGRNPFQDRRVRQAIYQAIDIDAIRSHVMQGAARPMALMVAPQVNGYAPDLDVRLPFDPAAARRLLAEAGWPEGFAVKLDCPNDRYVNDARICQAVAANLARVGVRVTVDAQPKAVWLPRVMRRETSFYLLGWTPVTVDAHDTLYAVAATPGPAGRGAFNLGSYSDPKLDDLIARIAAAPDRAARDALLREALRLHQDAIAHIPLHQQFLFWGARRNVQLVQLPSGRMPWKYVRIEPAAPAGRVK